MAPLRLRRGQGAMQRNPCYARLFADLPHTPQGAFSCPFGTIHLVSPNPMKASGGQSPALPVADEARRKPSEQGSARKAPRADAVRPLQTVLRSPNPQRFFDSLSASRPSGRIAAICFQTSCTVFIGRYPCVFRGAVSMIKTLSAQGFLSIWRTHIGTFLATFKAIHQMPPIFNKVSWGDAQRCQ